MQQGSRQKNTKGQGRQGAGVVRIIGGKHRGRKLHFPSANGLRPSLDRVRETLFNWLQGDIAGSHCLDLFAGSGALGFEALSRGAESVTMVELNPKVAHQLKSNAKILQADNLQVVNQSALDFLKHNNQQFDLVFLDPPFKQSLMQPVLSKLMSHIDCETLVYIEQAIDDDLGWQEDDSWQQVKEKKSSQIVYGLYQYNQPNT